MAATDVEDNIRKAVADRFEAAWPVQTYLPKNRVVLGKARDPLNVQDGSWGRLTTTVFEGENAQIGTDMQRYPGIIAMQIFVNKTADSAERTANMIAGIVRQVFQNRQFGGVSTFVCSAVYVGTEAQNYQVNAKVNFYFDVIS